MFCISLNSFWLWIYTEKKHSSWQWCTLLSVFIFGSACWSINILFPIGGASAVRKGAHGNLGAQIWLALPPPGPQFITYASPHDWSLHGNDLEWPSQGLQLCDWWWGERKGHIRSHRRKNRKDRQCQEHTYIHTCTHGPEVTVSHLTATLWLLSEYSRADAPSVPRDSVNWNLEAACSLPELSERDSSSSPQSLPSW